MEDVRISIKEAAKMMNCDQLFLRNAIVKGEVGGAFYVENKKRKTFYIKRKEFMEWLHGR